jgi:hypothetical protein
MLSVNPDNVARIEINTPEHSCMANRSNSPGAAWVCTDKPDHVVNTDAVTALLAEAASIKAARFIDFMPSDLSTYGLDSPRATVTFGYRSADMLQNTLLLGVAADDAWRYAMLLGHEFVFLLSETTATRLQQPLCTSSTETVPVEHTETNAVPAPVAITNRTQTPSPLVTPTP